MTYTVSGGALNSTQSNDTIGLQDERPACVNILFVNLFGGGMSQMAICMIVRITF